MWTLVLGNAILVLLTLDSLLSLASFGGRGPFAASLSLLLYVAVTLALLQMHLSPRLPKRVFVPACLWVVWCSLGAMPVPLWVPAQSVPMVLGLAQLALVVGLFALMRLRTGTIGLLSSDQLVGPAFSWHTVVTFTAANLLLILPALLLYAFLSAGAALDRSTSGFLRLGLDGLYAQERIYHRAEDTVRLIGTVHVARPEFYADVLDTLNETQGVILMEGVTDERGLLPASFDYAGVAEGVGLSSQAEAWSGRLEDHAVRADVDASEFTDQTIALLQKIGSVLSAFQNEDVSAVLAAVRAIDESDVDPQVFLRDLLEMRNAHVLAEFEHALIDYDQVIIPWGAAHMPGIEAGILKMGFEQTGAREWLVIAF